MYEPRGMANASWLRAHCACIPADVDEASFHALLDDALAARARLDLSDEYSRIEAFISPMSTRSDPYTLLLHGLLALLPTASCALVAPPCEWLEFGVASGYSLNLTARALEARGVVAAQLHGFDTFEGLPEAWGDRRMARGRFSQGGILPRVHPWATLYQGLINETLPRFLAQPRAAGSKLEAARPPTRLLLGASIDVDLYAGAHAALTALTPWLRTPGQLLHFHELVRPFGWGDARRHESPKCGWECSGAFGVGTRLNWRSGMNAPPFEEQRALHAYVAQARPRLWLVPRRMQLIVEAALFVVLSPPPHEPAPPPPPFNPPSPPSPQPNHARTPTRNHSDHQRAPLRRAVVASQGVDDATAPRAPYGACALKAVAAAMPAGSRALAAYLQRVYGAEPPPARLHGWQWELVDVLWLRYLVASVRETACTVPLGAAAPLVHGPAFVAVSVRDNWAKGLDATGLLWRFRWVDGCAGEPYSFGGVSGPRGADRQHDDWVEVSHVQVGVRPSWDEQQLLYLYRARGSGLWYLPGKTHARDDMHTLPWADLEAASDVTERPSAWHSAGPSNATTVAAEANAQRPSRRRGTTVSSSGDAWRRMVAQLRARGVETLEFVRRVADYVGSVNASGRCGAGAHTPFYTHEIVSLRPKVCDDDTQLVPASAVPARRSTDDVQGPATDPNANAPSLGTNATAGQREPILRPRTMCPGLGLCLPGVHTLRFGWPEELGTARCRVRGGCVSVHGRLLHCPFDERAVRPLPLSLHAQFKPGVLFTPWPRGPAPGPSRV
jgi:hypothetical protein